MKEKSNPRIVEKSGYTKPIINIMVFAAHFFYASLRMPMYAPKWVNKSEKMNDEPVHLGPNLINLQTTSNIKPK
jgi:hypothetical protein